MYTAIYRDFRPDRFEEIIGQDHIVKILKNQLDVGQTSHAYLFCGTRGTGKTTTARVLAKALNCTGSGKPPCCGCESCVSIKEGSFIDVIEIDAASNNSVDDIRELCESVNYPPIMGKYKIYIIDEVHMLSGSAFNALLKTLEEPPIHVVFILATTEVHKLPATILSRCMRLNFRRVSEKDIIGNMKNICQMRNVSFEEEALSMIAINADGSIRDSLSILEQCISGTNELTLEDTAEILGAVGEESLIRLTRLIMDGEISSALLLLNELIDSGRDLKQIMRDWLAHFRNLLISKFVKSPIEMLCMSTENAERIVSQSRDVSLDFLNRGITELTRTIADAKWSSQPRALFEMCLVRLGSVDVIIEEEKQVTIEKSVEKGIRPKIDKELNMRSGTGSKSEKKPENLHQKKSEKAPDDKKHADTDIDLYELWNDATGDIVKRKKSLICIQNKTYLKSVNENTFVLNVEDETVLGFIDRLKGSEVIEKVMSEKMGRPLKIVIEHVPVNKNDSNDGAAASIAADLKKIIDVDIKIK